jgi:subtilisin-like proprotein convertase family protein
LLLSALFVGLTAAPASAVVFTSNTNLTIPSSGNATPNYPDTIAVSGLVGVVADVNVTLDNISHLYPDDVDVLLVGPTGADVILMSDVGAGLDLTSDDLAFTDGAGALPDSAQISSGTYSPTQGVNADVSSCCGYQGAAPTGPPFGSSLSVFNGTNPNGTWSLYVYDDTSPDGGSISSGWDLEIIMAAPTVTSFTPTSGPPGTAVTITGTNLQGVTSVTFGGVPSTSITNNTPTSVTATVPANAVTGPIGVTTPNGTATSATSFTVVPPPTVTSFTPGAGLVGAQVVITGTTFTNVSSVSFNGVSAVFTVNSSTQITATVPPGATTGPIAVTTASGTGTSAADFIVQHAREVTLHFSKAKGKVTVLDGFGACASGVPVKLQLKGQGGGFKNVRNGFTKPAGAYNLGTVIDGERYRVVAKTFSTPSGDKCLKDVSPTVKA